MSQFLTSDLHLGGRSVYGDYSRPFKTYDEFEETIINNINSVVSNRDDLYILGDFIDFSKTRSRSMNREESFDKAKLINGKKRLIIGNNERRLIDAHFGSLDSFERYAKSKGFSWCQESCNIDLAGNLFHLVHEPKNCRHDVLNLYGHIHRDVLSGPYGINVSCDLWGYYPVSVRQLVCYIERTVNYSLPARFVNKHEMWDKDLWLKYREVWKKKYIAYSRESK